MSTTHDKVDAFISSDAVEITRDQLYPFIFARATEESQKLYEAGKTTALVVRDWVVVIALPDFKVYDSRWMCDPEQGDFCLIPDVDISFDKDRVFPTFADAREFIGKWWVSEITGIAIGCQTALSMN